MAVIDDETRARTVVGPEVDAKRAVTVAGCDRALAVARNGVAALGDHALVVDDPSRRADKGVSARRASLVG